MDKKKKVIVIAVAAVLVIGIAAIVYFAMSKNDNSYVDVPITEVVTNENGETVTNEEGQPVTETVTDTQGKPQTTKKAQQNNGGGSDDDNNRNDADKPSNQPDNKKPDQDDKPEDKKPKSRKITITAVLPSDCALDDVMQIYVDGELDCEVTVGDYIVSGKTVSVTTEEKYLNKVTVAVTLKNYGVTETRDVENNEPELEFNFRLNHVENIEGEDD